METEKIVVNPDDSEFWENRYEIELNHAPGFIVYASNLQDALDYMIDFWEETESDNPGYFLSEKEIKEEEYLEEYVYGGNYCRYTSFGWHEMIVRETRVN